MGKLQEFEIVFEGANDVFKPGDTIKGQVKIVVTAEKGDIRGIIVRCIGKAFTHWTESRGTGDNRRTIHYTWKVPYFKQELVLRGAGKDNKSASRMTLPPGDHRFPFQFQVPQQSLPPPFEGTVGWVRYFIKATIDRPWKFDHKTKRFFSIWTTKDLNLYPNILHSPSGITEKTVCCLCCESGPISVKGHIDKSGYAPGEYILVSLDLNNQSSRTICSLTIALYQMVIYRAKHGGSVHTREGCKKITELQLDGCGAMDSINLDRRQMLIPPVAPNSFENCPNIDVAYIVKIEADVSGTPVDASVTLPFIIGTVPAFPHTVQPGIPVGAAPQQAPGGFAAGYPPQPGQPQPGQPQPGYPPQPGAQGYPPAGTQGATGYDPNYQSQPSAPFLPPPTYEMAVGGPQEIAGKDGTFGTITYAPRYPYYNPDTMYQSMGQPQGPGQGQPQGQAPVAMQPQSQPQSQYNPYQQQQQQQQQDPIEMKEYPPM